MLKNAAFLRRKGHVNDYFLDICWAGCSYPCWDAVVKADFSAGEGNIWEMVTWGASPIGGALFLLVKPTLVLRRQRNVAAAGGLEIGFRTFSGSQ